MAQSSLLQSMVCARQCRGLGASFKAQPTTHAAVGANGFAQELEALLLQVGEGSLVYVWYPARTLAPEGNFKSGSFNGRRPNQGERHGRQ